MKMLQEFWDFVRERELIRLRRLAGLPREQWTSDEILQTYSFTNVKRHHDRVTRLLLTEFYDPHRLFNDQKQTHLLASAEILRMYLLNAAIFRYFGTLESARTIGWLYEWSPDQKSRLLEMGSLLSFTPAYLVPNCGDTRAKYVVVCDIIDSIWSVATEVVAQTSWQRACEILSRCWGCGSFMAKEVYLDFLLARGEWRPSDWQTWTPVGPGGQRGATWVRDGLVLSSSGKQTKMDEDEALEVIRVIYESRFNDGHWHEPMRVDDDVLDPVDLDLTDVQFQLCEFDKYNRAKSGGRPKRKFRPTVDEITRG